MNRIFALRWRIPLFRRLALWLAKNTPSCREMARLSSASLERALTPRERLLRLAHFLACDWCLRYARQLRFLRTAARSLAHRETCADLSHSHPVPHPLPVEARQRLKHRLGRESPPTPPPA
ncbi:MAG: hypothetical protein JNK85_04850 [Verrucomicrobiales bacterium]|nr:hypothetical protein [Verrucomicrobiales bacterium]